MKTNYYYLDRYLGRYTMERLVPMLPSELETDLTESIVHQWAKNLLGQGWGRNLLSKSGLDGECLSDENVLELMKKVSVRRILSGVLKSLFLAI